jgi:hypothetical protein
MSACGCAAESAVEYLLMIDTAEDGQRLLCRTARAMLHMGAETKKWFSRSTGKGEDTTFAGIYGLRPGFPCAEAEQSSASTDIKNRGRNTLGSPLRYGVLQCALILVVPN